MLRILSYRNFPVTCASFKRLIMVKEKHDTVRKTLWHIGGRNNVVEMLPTNSVYIRHSFHNKNHENIVFFYMFNC